MFGRSQLLSVEATKALRKGEALSMDYGTDKLDNTLLLDYGVLDTASAQVSSFAPCTQHAEDRKSINMMSCL